MKKLNRCLYLALSLAALWLAPRTMGAANRLRLHVVPEGNGVFLSPAKAKALVSVVGQTGDTAVLTLEVLTDDHQTVMSVKQALRLTADSLSTAVELHLPSPGFYRLRLSAENAETVERNIGYEPERIVSLSDAQPDFDAFWQQALDELATVAPEYTISEEKDKSGKARKVYLVRMKSLDGEPISAYLTMPVKRGRYPALIHYMGYHNKPWYAKPEDHPGWVELVLSVRGQSLQEPTNHYGEWICYGLESPKTYYYRGAYMDCIRAIDYMCTLPQVDQRNLFAEGGSQGGAFTYVACALDHRIQAACPWIPFMNDFPDYFRIEPWPANLVLKQGRQLGMSDSDIYRVLSYFDIKNFARRVRCPILMGWGLQDHTCPPHTNFAGYNLLGVEKQQVVYPKADHIDLPGFPDMEMDFFRKHLK